MGGSLTVSERILFHLSAYVKYEGKYEAPFGITQDGIAQACGISRAHAAIELKKLKASGIVDERLSHVRRGKTRRKVYFLSHEGKQRGSAIVQYVRENNIDAMVDPDRISQELDRSRGRRARKSSPMPDLKYFFGRRREIAELTKALTEPSLKVISLRGIAGIGKTTLAVRLASTVTGQRVFWHAVKPWDSPKSVADALGAFFSENGSKRLANYLSSGRFEMGEVGFLLNEVLVENGYLFIFDDADSSPSAQDFLRLFRLNCGPGKMVVTVESQPGFYDPEDVIATREVAEVELDGLERGAALDILRVRGIEGEIADEMVTLTKGHPLSLEMVTVTNSEEARYQVSRFFEEKFYADLDESEKSLLQLASVFQRPFSVDAIPRELRSVRKASMLREVAPGRFEIHASLREFVYGHMSADDRARWHSVVADYYLRQEESSERLHHLLRAGRTLEAEMLIAREGESLIEGGDPRRMWDLLRAHDPIKERYLQPVNLLKGRLASLVGEHSEGDSILGNLAAEAETPVRAEALVELGLMRSRQGRLEEASSLFSEALALSAGEPRLRAKALRGTGVVEAKLGNHDRAKELLEASAVDSLSAMDQNGMLRAHMELGKVLMEQGRFEDAIGHFSKCAAGFGPADLAGLYSNLGVACLRLGRAQDARVNLENAVRLSEETGQPRTLAGASMELCGVLLSLGEIVEARERCFHALEVFTELDDRLGVSSAYHRLSEIEGRAGDSHASEECCRESLRALEGVDAPREVAMRRMEIGRMLAESGSREAAAEQLSLSLELFRSVEDNDMVDSLGRELRTLRGGEGQCSESNVQHNLDRVP
jgi:tetratricopeptide (TPR) repeat protein